MKSKYKTLKELKQSLDLGNYPDCYVYIDNDVVYAYTEGDEEDRCLYESFNLRDVLHEALSLLEIKSEDV